MTNNADITIFNKRIGEDRREVFFPTMISGASWYGVRSVIHNERARDGDSKFMIRIPYDAVVQDGRQYLPEDKYHSLTDQEALMYWTIQLNDYVVNKSYDEGVLATDEIGIAGSPVTIVEYADNTVRGSDYTKHWRIGGA